MNMQQEDNRAATGNGPLATKRCALSLTACAFALVVLAATAVHADVRVVLTDGETIDGDRIGRTSDAERLALRVEGPGIVLTRFIDWNAVRSVQVEGRTIDVAELQNSAGDEEPAETETRGRRGIPQIPGTDRSRRRSAEVWQTSASNVRPMRRPPVRPVPPPPCLRKPPLRRDIIEPSIGLPLEAKIIGIREAPLNAYRDGVEAVFPHGVPVSERPFALHLMRSRTARDVLVPEAYLRPPVESGPGL